MFRDMMFLKTLAVSTSVIGTIVYTQYAAFSKDKDNRTHHPGRMHPTKLVFWKLLGM